jgi:hypothetical protein
MLPILILLVGQINPYGEAQAQIIVPSATGALMGAGGGGLGAALQGGGARIGVDVMAAPQIAVDPQVDLYRTTQGGLIDDYRLAEALINRTALRRAEALRLMAAANNIEVQNARLRAYLCSRFCNTGVGINPLPAIPPTPMFPADIDTLPADPLLLPGPLPYAPPREDFNARYYIRHGGTVQVQVAPQIPVYRRRY